VGAAIVVIGGAVFMRFALLPAAKQLPDDVHNDLRERVMGSWRKFVGIGILLLLLTGFGNYFLAMPTDRVADSKLYHPLMGVKIILAMGVFFLAAALSGRAKALEGLRRNAALWLVINILLAAVIVAIAGYLKVAVKS
jgi:hypothetical protein